MLVSGVQYSDSTCRDYELFLIKSNYLSCDESLRVINSVNLIPCYCVHFLYVYISMYACVFPLLLNNKGIL